MLLWIGPTDIFHRDSFIKFVAGGVVKLLFLCRFKVTLNEAKLEMHRVYFLLAHSMVTVVTALPSTKKASSGNSKSTFFLKFQLAFFIQDFRIVNLHDMSKTSQLLITFLDTRLSCSLEPLVFIFLIFLSVFTMNVNISYKSVSFKILHE
jgi:hypothetical protein